jgi:hypothetical protein
MILKPGCMKKDICMSIIAYLPPNLRSFDFCHNSVSFII